eukprot:TRINITY_DN1873_c0_g3_i1.p1 TRINITY_DN1873_c0_g3~~TRINITY_DN1873_c0_g3_i1.p1  ORF type:complete len:236 (+),score=35.12 TRINITY_DN1873_c0_g3_i1:313-1020(+)
MCSLQRKGNVFILTLTGNGDHRFNESSMDAISDALQTVAKSTDAVALVTTNDGRYFSNGLDLKWISENPSARLEIIRVKFENLLASLMRLGVPTVAAMRGHAAAGGLVFAMAHDYRFMSKGRSVLYMSELDIGMKMPRSLMSLVRSKMSPSTLREVVMKARRFRPQEALDHGLIDRLCEDSDETLSEAIQEAEKLASRKWRKDVYAQLRMRAFSGVVEELDAHHDRYAFPVSSKL